MNYALQLRVFLLAAAVGLLLTALTMIGSRYLLGSGWPSGLELWAVMTSYASTLLFVLQRRQAYLWGAVTTILYSVLFLEANLRASAAVQIYLLGALLYGYFRWGPDGRARRVTLVDSYRTWSIYLAVTVVTWIGALTVAEYYGSSVAGWDSAILVASILAQWLLDNKKLETWIVWIGVNIVAIPLYWSQGLHLVSIQYVVFLLNAIWGLHQWHSSRIDDRLEIALGRARAQYARDLGTIR